VTGALHEEIADELREMINSGEYEPGERLPTEPELESHFQVSRSTIRRAISTLTHEGLIQLQPGRGMFVPKGPPPFIVILSSEEGGGDAYPGLDSYRSGVRAAGRSAGIRNFERRIEYPDGEIAHLLDISEDDQVVVRSSQRYIDDRPCSLQSSYYPMDMVRGTEIESREKIDRGTIKVLEELGHKQAGYRDELTARMPTPAESVARRPIRLTVTAYAADRNRPSYEIGTVPARHYVKGQIATTG
jgi:GntR family transcriptional regulator